MSHKTRTKIIEAVIGEVERVGLRVTTKQIAERAGVNELTLFRHFGSKQQLIMTAIGQMMGPASDAHFVSSGDMRADLRLIITQYVQLIDNHPRMFVQILSTTDPSLVNSIVLPLQQQIATSLAHLVEFYKHRGELNDLPTEDLIRELMGPILARAFLNATLVIRPLDVDHYITRFLGGHQALHNA